MESRSYPQMFQNMRNMLVSISAEIRATIIYRIFYGICKIKHSLPLESLVGMKNANHDHLRAHSFSSCRKTNICTMAATSNTHSRRVVTLDFVADDDINDRSTVNDFVAKRVVTTLQLRVTHVRLSGRKNMF